MLANNLIFIVMWWLFFREFQTVGGWQMKDMIALLAIGQGSYALMALFFGGTRDLGKIIINGNLDPFMTQPKNLLLHIAGSKSAAKSWGHLATTIFLIFFGGLYDLKTLSLILFTLCTGCLVFTSIRIIAHSLTFWLGPVEHLSERYADALFLFALYPTNIYSGILQVVMFTLIPAGVITYLPVELIRSFSWEKVLTLLVSGFFFSAAAIFIFYKGLKRYESGNQLSLRT